MLIWWKFWYMKMIKVKGAKSFKTRKRLFLIVLFCSWSGHISDANHKLTQFSSESVFICCTSTVFIWNKLNQYTLTVLNAIVRDNRYRKYQLIQLPSLSILFKMKIIGKYFFNIYVSNTLNTKRHLRLTHWFCFSTYESTNLKDLS